MLSNPCSYFFWNIYALQTYKNKTNINFKRNKNSRNSETCAFKTVYRTKQFLFRQLMLFYTDILENILVPFHLWSYFEKEIKMQLIFYLLRKFSLTHLYLYSGTLPFKMSWLVGCRIKFNRHSKDLEL